MSQHYIETTKTARYYTSGTLGKETKYIWFVCHGYQQLASYFIKNFSDLDNSHFVVAPEGFHRFYLNGYSGRVGASWMTSEDRLNDIRDYVNYLDKIYETILNQIDHLPTINVLGFSQGGATVSRWVCQGKSKIDNLILWATVFPPDLNFEVDATVLNKLNFQLVIGNEDEFVNEEVLEKHANILKENNIKYKLTRFKGKHKIYPDVLQKIVNKL